LRRLFSWVLENSTWAAQAQSVACWLVDSRETKLLVCSEVSASALWRRFFGKKSVSLVWANSDWIWEIVYNLHQRVL
jgi:hypothetical protein